MVSKGSTARHSVSHGFPLALCASLHVLAAATGEPGF